MDNYEELVDSNPAVCDLFQSPDRPIPGFSVFICFFCCDYWPTANSNVTASIQFFLNLKKFHQGPVWGSRHICHCCAVAGVWGCTPSDFHIKDFFETDSSINQLLGKPSEKKRPFFWAMPKLWAQINLDTFWKAKKLPKLHAGGRGVFWAMPKRKFFFLGGLLKGEIDVSKQHTNCLIVTNFSEKHQLG